MGIQTSTINSGPVSGFKNQIINGNFDFWQRGTSLTSGTGDRYLADRWVTSTTGSSCTPSRQLFTLGQSDVPGNPSYFHRVITSSVAGASNYVILQQRVEGVAPLAGQQVTVSFWAKADSTRSIAVSVDQYFGSGGSPSATVTGSGVKYVLTSSWQKIKFTYTLPSVSGKTLGTNSNDALLLQIWLDAGSSFNSRTDSLGQQSGTFDIARVQLELGPVATDFEQRPQQVELALCQRYFGSYRGGAFLYSLATSVNNVPFYTPVVMRSLPVAAILANNLGANTATTTVVPRTTHFVEITFTASAAGYAGATPTFTLSSELTP